MFKKLAVLMGAMTLLVGCSSGGGTADSSATSQTKDVLTMGTNAGFPPFEYYEGNNIVGFDVDLAGLIAEELGMELKIEDMEFNSLIGAVNSGMIDIAIAGISVTEDKVDQVEFTQTYFVSNQSIIVPVESDILDADDLIGKTIGVQLSTTGDILAQDIEDAKIVQFSKAALAVADLKNGTVDAVIIDNEPAKQFVSGQLDIMVLPTAFVEEDYAMAIKKGNIELLDAVNGALDTIIETGKYDELYNKYFDFEE
ncbi:MAG: hypothetical protein ATN35_03755 [Epulopiscium sp. Nele67-Bin004]|nr:MAG: hypothetical protein ATN35_03755 [Epulopiscium sp. Nele67-Bin004]